MKRQFLRGLDRLDTLLPNWLAALFLGAGVLYLVTLFFP